MHSPDLQPDKMQAYQLPSVNKHALRDVAKGDDGNQLLEFVMGTTLFKTVMFIFYRPNQQISLSIQKISSINTEILL